MTAVGDQDVRRPALPGGIGDSVTRREDLRLLEGNSSYLGDLRFADLAEAVFVRSEHAHARIRTISTAAARRHPGVLAVVTGPELAEWVSPLRIAPKIEGLQPMSMPPLATGRVRFHGDPVAIVVATDRYVAEDAAELVEVTYDPLPAAMDIRESLAGTAPLVDDSLPSNVLCDQRYVNGNPAAVIESAAQVIRVSFAQHRQTHGPLEPRGCVAVWDRSGQHLTCHTGTQVPAPYRTSMAARLGLPEHQVSVVCPDVGGSFGQKLVAYREDVAVAAVARQLGRPVRWREDRRENLLSALHAREDEVDLEVAFTAEGVVQAVRARLRSDFGAYAYFPGNYMLQVVGMMIPGPYRFQDFEYDLKVVLSNKTPAGPYRAPMAMCTWVTEGMMDAVAHALGKDPVEVRTLNLLSENELPYRSAAGQVYEHITPTTTFHRAVEAFGYEQARVEQAKARAEGRLVGIGVASVVEPTTYGSAFYKLAGIPGSGHEAALVRIAPSGAVSVSTGLMSTGQGYETMLSQVVSEGLGVPADTVHVLLGDTDVPPYGMGSRGSRGATAGGGVALLAARDLRDKVLRIAAHRIGTDAGLLTVSGGAIHRLGPDGSEPAGLTVADVAAIAYLDPTLLPPGVEPGLEILRAYDPPPMTFSNSVHLCRVEITPDRGAVRIGRYVIAEDAGRLINPLMVEGQLHGAVALGLAGALQEQVVYSPEGRNLTDSFRDYPLLALDEMVDELELVHCDTPNRRTPGGMKGMSEGGVMGGIAALTLAVQDALGTPVDQLPLTGERICELLDGRA
ncbi:MAG TPA: xanthine dehydrogenase family protein molybdopterin-binding subunit [Amycolatopsis sp.]|nr:xanthine dehydrogenase family protein molybdopterin-binding subunit [Amycolatopsis sp.]